MTEAILKAARLHWGLGEAPIKLAAARENQVFRVDAPGGTAALRLHRPGYRSDAQLHSELQWMAMLSDHGMAVPSPIPARDESLLLKIDGVVVDMLTWLDGTPMSQVVVTRQTNFDLGKLLADMHILADQWTPPADFTRPEWDLVSDQPSWGRFWENPALTPSQITLLAGFRDQARSVLAGLEYPDIGLIHADLVPDNVLIADKRLQPIDFDDGGFGHRLFDLSTITHRSRRGDPSGDNAAAVIAGYQAIRPVDTSNLPLFESLRAASYVGWNMARIDEPGAAERNARFVVEAETAVKKYLQG
ncbi:MAG: phosphotransferase [Rhizobiaceae bacterium]